MDVLTRCGKTFLLCISTSLLECRQLFGPSQVRPTLQTQCCQSWLALGTTAMCNALPPGVHLG